MRIGALDLNEPIPALKEPVAFAVLRPWIDVNNVGTLLLDGLEKQFEARELGKFEKPGDFFDFTRYRPDLYYEEGKRRMSIPNTTVRYAQRESGNDLLFLHLLEPHAMAEVYVDSVLNLLKTFKAKKYCLLGSMYDVVPHTKPLIVNGGAVGKGTEFDLRRSGALPSDYQGPTSIVTLITQMAPELGIETIWFVVSLPQYVSLEEDYLGKLRLMEVLNRVYGIPVDPADYEKAQEQRRLISQRVERAPELKSLVPQLETLYDVRIKRKAGEKKSDLSKDLEEILWKIDGKDFGKA